MQGFTKQETYFSLNVMTKKLGNCQKQNVHGINVAAAETSKSCLKTSIGIHVGAFRHFKLWSPFSSCDVKLTPLNFSLDLRGSQLLLLLKQMLAISLRLDPVSSPNSSVKPKQLLEAICNQVSTGKNTLRSYLSLPMLSHYLIPVGNELNYFH